MTTKAKYFGLEGKEIKTVKGAVCSEANGVYRIARLNSGVEAGFFVNPRSLYFNEDLLNSFDDNRGEQSISLVKVPKEAFDNYVKFLQTGKNTYLRNVQDACI